MDRSTWTLGWMVAGLVAGLGACGNTEASGSELSFLAACDATCAGGFSCVCGACTKVCSGDDACGGLGAQVRCVPPASECTGVASSVCDVACSGAADCEGLGTGFSCVEARCRGPGGSGSAGAGGGAGASAGGAAGASAGGRSAGGAGGGATSACDTVGAPCCDPFPGDGQNYCAGGLECSARNVCQAAEPDCDCALGAYVPVCGVDGTTYDSACGSECVPVAVACRGECPCSCGAEGATGCADLGSPCCGGLECCAGVPYDETGECRSVCDMRSDRNQKTDVQTVEPGDVLDTLASLPIQSWSYTTEPGVRHLGPMAQEFRAAFHLGADDRVIATVDASGVALASIQALARRMDALERENDELRRRLSELAVR